MSNLDQSCLILNLALALKKNGSWAGETHIQKAAYYLKELLNVPFEADFLLYKHGPFSFDLREQLTDMEGLGFIKWNSLPPYGPSVAEGPFGEQLRAKFSSLSDQYATQIDFIARRLGQHNVASLERIATALYVTMEGYQGSARVARIIELKPHVDVPLAEKAVQEFDSIRNEAAQQHLIASAI